MSRLYRSFQHASRGLASRRRWALPLAAALAVVCAGTPARGDGAGADDFLRNLAMRRGKIETYAAGFVQKRTLTLFDEVKTSAGRVLYKAPRQMIWKYETPDKTQMRIAGDSVSFYFPELEQIEIYPPGNDGAASHFFFAFEASADELEESFDVSVGASEDGRLRRIELSPRPGEGAPQLQGLTMWLDNSDYLPRRILIREVSGDTTEIEFTDVRVNEPINAQELNFNAPDGTKIIESGGGLF